MRVVPAIGVVTLLLAAALVLESTTDSTIAGGIAVVALVAILVLRYKVFGRPR